MERELTEKLDHFKNRLSSMKRGKHKGQYRPHKPLLLLAIIDLLERGAVRQNRFPLGETLVNQFRQLFFEVESAESICRVTEPYYHLRTSGFWYHKPHPGLEHKYTESDASGSGVKRICDLIDYAFFDQDSFAVLTDSESRAELRGYILSQFFDEAQSRQLLSCLGG